MADDLYKALKNANISERRVTKKEKKSGVNLDETVLLILIGPDNYYKEFGAPKRKDWGTQHLGQAFQKALREEVHKHNKEEFACKYCGGTGVYFRLEEKDGDATNYGRQKFLEEAAIFTELEMTENIKILLDEKNLKGGTKKGKNGNPDVSKVSVTGSRGINKIATPIFNIMLNDTRKLMADVQAYQKAHKKELLNSAKKYAGVTGDDGRALTGAAKLTDAFVNKWRLPDGSYLFAKCPSCDGNGYYDVAHDDFFGKQHSVMMWLYDKYIRGKAVPEWDRKITRQEVWDKFFTLKYSPKWANRPSYNFALNAKIEAEKLAANRYHIFTDRNKRAKAELYAEFYALYKGEKTFLFEDRADLPTFGEIAKLYTQLSLTARKKSGTLKKFLLSEATRMRQLGSSTVYPTPYVVIEGPTAHSRGYNSSKNNMYVYAAKFIRSGLREEGFGTDAQFMPWNKKNQEVDVEGLAKDAFGSKFDNIKIKYFPQRVT